MKKLLFFCTALLTVLFLVLPAFAQTTQDQSQVQVKPEDQTAQQTADTARQNRQAPLTYDLKIKPGESDERTLVITNFQDKPVKVYSTVVDFDVMDEEGNIRFSNTVSSERSLAPWVTVTPVTFDLDAQETKSVKFKVDVPVNTAAGTRWATLIFQSVDMSDAKNPVPVGGSGALVLVTVAPEGESLTENFNFLSLKAEKKKGEENTYTFTLRVSNKGQTFFRPRGSIVLKNIWGKEIERFPVSEAVVFPQTVGKILTDRQMDKALFGYYKVSLEGFYGDQNQEFDVKGKFWALPFNIKFAGYVLILIVVVVLAIYIDRMILRRRARRRKMLAEKE